jgi:hypothetical protein
MTTAQGNLSSSAAQQTPFLLTKEIQDLYVRKNLQNLVGYFSAQNQFLNFEFFEIVLTAATTAVQTLQHTLGYVPKDVVITQITGVGTIQFQYGNFTSTTLSYTATGACRVRFFVGTYFADTSTVTAQATDIQTVAATPLSASKNVPVAVTGSYQMTGLEYMVRASTTGIGATFGAVISLPLAPTQGQIAIIQKTDANTHPVTITVAATSASRIVPPSSVSFTITAQYKCVQLVFDGTNWCVINSWSGTI